jgi:hypothetical protein
MDAQEMALRNFLNAAGLFTESRSRHYYPFQFQSGAEPPIQARPLSPVERLSRPNDAVCRALLAGVRPELGEIG